MFGNTKKCSEYLLHLVHRRNGFKGHHSATFIKEKDPPSGFVMFLSSKETYKENSNQMW